ncbi:MAG: YeeE/YedE thiosulfate transporter family protein, partial [Acetobacteraceae bacterium]
MATSLALPLPRRLPSPGVAAALLLLAGGALFLGDAHGWRHAALWLVGAALGFVLHRAAFGFAGAFRRLFAEGRTAGVRAQIVLLGLGATLFLPVLAWGPALGLEVRGYVFPAGVGTLLGAFLFGLGMQWAAGCVSGTLYA